MKNILEVKNLTKKYKRFTLDGVNIEVQEGCIMGFIGANGAGKSTTIKGILGAINLDEGEVNVLNQGSLAKNHKLKEHVGVVLEQSNFSETMTFKEINQFMKLCYKTWEEKVFYEYGERFHLEEKKKIKEYSRGMKMKLSLAVALSHDSKLLILDEATSGLDPIIRDEILEIFQEFIQDEKKSIFISSHILSDLEKICDYITFIHEGKIVLCEEKDVLLETYCMVKCERQVLDELSNGIVKGVRYGQFGAEALMLRSDARNLKDVHVEAVTLEEIMLFIVRGEK